MKWIVGVLLLLNAGLFMWAYGKRPDATEYIRPTVNGETMMLISEMQPARSTVVITPAKGASEPESEPATVGEPLPEDTQQVAVNVVPPFCLRVGPFYDENLAEQTKERLRAMSLAVNTRTVQAREIRAYRVFLGPFETREGMGAKLKELNEKGIRDHYVKRNPGEKDIISLGLFTQQTGAESLKDQLLQKGVEAKSETEARLLDPSFWLELTDSAANRKSHSELATVSSWGDNRTKMAEFPCS